MIPRTDVNCTHELLFASTLKKGQKGVSCWCLLAGSPPPRPGPGERSRLNCIRLKKVKRHFVKMSTTLVIWSSDTFASWNIVVMRPEVI